MLKQFACFNPFSTSFLLLSRFLFLSRCLPFVRFVFRVLLFLFFLFFLSPPLSSMVQQFHRLARFVSFVILRPPLT